MSERLYHRLQGEGHPLLLLNGVTGTTNNWEELVRQFPAGYRILRCDFRGQLRSPGPPPPRQTDHVEDLIELLDSLGVQKTHVVGTSFGGAVGCLMAARYPGRVSSLVAVTVGAGDNPELRSRVAGWQESCRAILAGGERTLLYDQMESVVYSREFLDALGSKRTTFRRQFAALPDAWYSQLVTLLESVESRLLGEVLPEIRCPALVVGGGADRLVPVERVLELAAGIPVSGLEVLPGAGHALPIEQPVGLAQRILLFLEESG